jgi:hypothetical protein
MALNMKDEQIAVRSHLVHALVQHDRDHTSETPNEPWPNFYARHLREQFASR